VNAIVKEHPKELLLTPMEEEAFRLATPYLQVRDNERHTWDALGFALRLLERHEGEREVVGLATILHDVGWIALSKEQLFKAWGPFPDVVILRLHEEAGMETAARILGEIDCDRAVAEKVIAIIDGHDTRTSALSLNDKVVKDADKLTRYGAGFWTISHLLSIAPDELSRHLERLVDEWFFLDFSRWIAREELAMRRLEVRPL
jgi:HD superfamily phosphohydrolase YqeK